MLGVVLSSVMRCKPCEGEKRASAELSGTFEGQLLEYDGKEADVSGIMEVSDDAEKEEEDDDDDHEEDEDGDGGSGCGKASPLFERRSALTTMSWLILCKHNTSSASGEEEKDDAMLSMKVTGATVLDMRAPGDDGGDSTGTEERENVLFMEDK